MAKVENAIIMAAGIGSRFVPLSYELPKGLLRVKGEVLIERQIKQLNEVGIHDIVVVVGYKKELFYYLKEKFGVEIVVNEDYYRYNNASTLMCVADKISSTYICSSDNYFTENVFELEVPHAYYAAVYSEENTEEWCLDIDADGMIKDVSIGGRAAWYMLGHAYFSPEFSKKFLGILKREYEKEETKNQLWEKLYARYINELPMHVKKYDVGVIKEFDTLAELRQFDKTYCEESGSEIMKLIAAQLHCNEYDIIDIEEMCGGLTNKSFKFTVKHETYVFRYPGEGTEELINRKHEMISTHLAEEIGIDTECFYFDGETGIKISRYIDNAQTMTAELFAKSENLQAAAEVLYKLHTCGKDTGVVFDVFEMAESYEKYILKHGVPLFEDYEEIKRKVYALEEKHDALQPQLVPCHNDVLSANWVRGTDRIYLIDWEYAGMNDPMWDVADLAIEAEMTREQEKKYLKYYFGREPKEQEVWNFAVNKVFIDYLWALWGKTRVPYEGESMNEYASGRYERLKDNIRNIEYL